MLVPIKVDSDVEVIFKGNDEHGYLYLAGNAGLVGQEHARAAVCKTRESGRKCNDVQEVGEERDNNEAGVKRYVFHTDPGSRLRVEGDAIELSDDDEISIASEDAGDAEAAEEDDAGDEGAVEKKCGKGSKREGCNDGNDVNDNAWPRSGMQGRSYHQKLGKKMDHHKAEMLKWKNGVGERIEQKLAGTYKKMGCIAAVECYSLRLGEYSVELTNSRRLVVKLEQQTYTCKQWHMRGLPCCHALAVIAKANL
ncbi:hypothetical protein Cgig2_032812 [Carnegiea gigantea]|uniref:SWIM-type domain-containing protein n=1 Tax=Carnegiea gigantea TaxID=171969 RepID=A0A9Q1GSI2_9CARY|nr:hypothetical protein Cgig2_032812 [Carnegiea gigantea]